MTMDASGDTAVRTLRAARLNAQGLANGFDSTAAAIAKLVCMQAQDLGAAKWVLGARVAGTDEASVDRAVADRTVLRSWPMRGTLHFVDPSMLRPILSLTRDRLMQRAAKTHRDEGIDDELHARARRVAVRELEGGRALTRDELQAAWAVDGIEIAGQRGYHLIWRLAHEGLLCFGPVVTRARQQLVLLDEWSPRRPDEPADVDEILTRLITGYARGHGPVTVRDFAWWAGLTLTQARRAREAAGAALVAFDDDHVIDADSADRPIPEPHGAHALAAFDEYFLGYGDRSASCSPEDALRVVPGKNGLFLPTLVHDGEVVGTWRRSPERRGVTDVEVTPFHAETQTEPFRAALLRWAEFWSTELGQVKTTTPAAS